MTTNREILRELCLMADPDTLADNLGLEGAEREALRDRLNSLGDRFHPIPSAGADADAVQLGLTVAELEVLNTLVDFHQGDDPDDGNYNEEAYQTLAAKLAEGDLVVLDR